MTLTRLGEPPQSRTRKRTLRIGTKKREIHEANPSKPPLAGDHHFRETSFERITASGKKSARILRPAGCPVNHRTASGPIKNIISPSTGLVWVVTQFDFEGGATRAPAWSRSCFCCMAFPEM